MHILEYLYVSYYAFGLPLYFILQVVTPDTVVKIEPAESKSYWVERRGTKSGVRLRYDELDR